MNATVGSQSIADASSELWGDICQLGCDRRHKSPGRRKIASTSREEEARAKTAIVMILTGNRQSNGCFSSASHTLKPIYPRLPISIGPFLDLFEYVVPSAGKAE